MNDYKEHEIKVLDVNVQELAKRLGRCGREKASRYTKENIAKEWKKFLEDIYDKN